MAKRKLNVAMIGYDFMGRAHSNAWRQVGRFFQDLPIDPVLKVVVGRTAAKVKDAAARLGFEEHATSWQEVLARKDIDVVDICTPGDSHAEIAVAAAEAGKAILLQKPMAASAAGARRIIAAAQRASVDLQVSFMHRFFEEVVEARAWLGEGLIGRVCSVRLRNATPGPDWGEWFYARERVGHGVVDQLGVHGIDLALQLVGDVQSVSARMATLVPRRTLRDGRVVDVQTCDSAIAIYEFAGGAMGSHEMSMIEAQGCDRFRLELYGERGTMWLRTERGRLAVYAPDRLGADWLVPNLPEPPFGARQHAVWIAGVSGRGPRLNTAREALRGMEVVEAIARSSAQGGVATPVARGAA